MSAAVKRKWLLQLKGIHYYICDLCLGFREVPIARLLILQKRRLIVLDLPLFLQEQQNVQHMGDSADPFVVMEVLLLLENQE